MPSKRTIIPPLATIDRGYNDENEFVYIPSVILYLHLHPSFPFRPKDLCRLAYQPPRDLDTDYRFKPPVRPPALIIPQRIGRRCRILRIVGTHQLDPRWSVIDPHYAFQIQTEPVSTGGLTQDLMAKLDSPRFSELRELYLRDGGVRIERTKPAALLDRYGIKIKNPTKRDRPGDPETHYAHEDVKWTDRKNRQPGYEPAR